MRLIVETRALAIAPRWQPSPRASDTRLRSEVLANMVTAGGTKVHRNARSNWLVASPPTRPKRGGGKSWYIFEYTMRNTGTKCANSTGRSLGKLFCHGLQKSSFTVENLTPLRSKPRTSAVRDKKAGCFSCRSSATYLGFCHGPKKVLGSFTLAARSDFCHEPKSEAKRRLQR